MTTRDLGPTTSRPRRWLYLAGFGAGLSVWFMLAAWNVASRIPGIQILFLLSAVGGIGALRWLQPRPVLYRLGMVSMLLAGLAGWLSAPEGRYWVRDQLLHDAIRWPASGNIFTIAFILSFIVGWHLLAASAAGWRAGIAAYLGAGLLFLIAFLAAQLMKTDGAVLGRVSIASAFFSVLMWPAFTATFLGMFGWELD